MENEVTLDEISTAVESILDDHYRFDAVSKAAWEFAQRPATVNYGGIYGENN